MNSDDADNVEDDFGGNMLVGHHNNHNYRNHHIHHNHHNHRRAGVWTQSSFPLTHSWPMTWRSTKQ